MSLFFKISCLVIALLALEAHALPKKSKPKSKTCNHLLIDEKFRDTGGKLDMVSEIPGVSGIEYLRTNRSRRELSREWMRGLEGASSRSALGEPLAYPGMSDLLELKNLYGKRVLDAGTGDGLFVEQLQEKGIDAIGVDLALRKSQSEKSYFLERDIRNTGLPSKSFDIIVCAYSVFHYWDYTEPNLHLDALREMDRLLKPKGRIIVLNAHDGTKEIVNYKKLKLIYPPPGSAGLLEYYQYFLLEKP